MPYNTHTKRLIGLPYNTTHTKRLTRLPYTTHTKRHTGLPYTTYTKRLTGLPWISCSTFRSVLQKGNRVATQTIVESDPRRNRVAMYNINDKSD